MWEEAEGVGGGSPVHWAHNLEGTEDEALVSSVLLLSLSFVDILRLDTMRSSSDRLSVFVLDVRFVNKL